MAQARRAAPRDVGQLQRDIGRRIQFQGAVADRLLFETAVRVHRAGEGATFTGLKPAGLDVGPAIPLAERALATGDAAELVTFLTEEVRSEAGRRLALATSAGVPQARRWVEATLGLQVWAHGVHTAVHGAGHGGREHGVEETAAHGPGPTALLRDHPE